MDRLIRERYELLLKKFIEPEAFTSDDELKLQQLTDEIRERWPAVSPEEWAKLARAQQVLSEVSESNADLLQRLNDSTQRLKEHKP